MVKMGGEGRQGSQPKGFGGCKKWLRGKLLL